MQNDITYSNEERTLIIVNRGRNFHGSVDVTDPCYKKYVWCRMDNVKLAHGTYVCIAERLEYDVHVPANASYDGKETTYHENRISRIGIVNADLMPDLTDRDRYPDESALDFPEYSILGTHVDYVGDIGVDAGLAGFFHEKRDFSDAEWSVFCSQLKNWAGAYDTEDGFFSTSGYGDGCYGVYGITDPGGRDCYAALFIEFIPEGGDEDRADQ